jgi:hypothetical protein
VNPLPEYLHLQLEDALRTHRVVVWYDHDREFEPFIHELDRKTKGSLPMVKLGATNASLACYEGSFFALRLEIEPLVASPKPDPLLVYVPGEEQASQSSPLKELECAGMVYQRSLTKVAKHLLKRSYTDGAIDEMLSGKQLGYGDIAKLLEPNQEGGASILKLVLGELDAVAILAKWLDGTAYDKEIESKGGRNELLRLVATRSGLELGESTELAACRYELCRFLLLNEFRGDLACPEPSSISMVPRATLKEQREFIGRVLDMLRKDNPKTYEMIADSVEHEFALAKAEIPAATLGDIDTFRFEERTLLTHVGDLIAAGLYDEARNLVGRHRRSFWASQDLSRRQTQWELCATLADLGAEILRTRQSLQKTDARSKALVDAFTSDEGWHRVDSLHRRMESLVAQMQDEPEAEHAVAVIRATTDDVLRVMADAFAAAFEADKWLVPGVLHQTQIYTQKVAPLPGKVAWFHVDAMRFEMAYELARLLSESAETELTPAIAALPSITPLCMAALLPGASSSYSVVEHNGKAAARIGHIVLSDVSDRMNYLKSHVPDSDEITLENVLRLSGAKLQEKVAEARLLVVRSQDIDSLGEKHEMLARQLMDTVIGNIARAVRRLATTGYERFVITADHGYQFSSRKEDDMKLEAPTGNTLELHRRCWIGKGPNLSVGSVRILGADLGYDSPLEFVFPQGLGVFKAGGGLSYHHGGFSLQELVIPVLSFRMPQSGAKRRSSETSMRVLTDFQAITNRTFVIIVEADTNMLSTESIRLRVILVAKGEEVGYAGMAHGASFENKVLSIKPGERASVVMVLTKEGVNNLSIVAQDAGSPAVYAEVKNIPVKLK